IRMAVLAAPAVQGEPVAWVTADTVDGQTVNGKPRRIWWENSEGVGMPIYAAPQPAEQQPCHEDIRAGAPYDDPAFESLCREHEIWGTAAAAQCSVFWEAGKRVAEQRAATDVAELQAELERERKRRFDGNEQASREHREGMKSLVE